MVAHQIWPASSFKSISTVLILFSAIRAMIGSFNSEVDQVYPEACTPRIGSPPSMPGRSRVITTSLEDALPKCIGHHDRHGRRWSLGKLADEEPLAVG